MHTIKRLLEFLTRGKKKSTDEEFYEKLASIDKQAAAIEKECELLEEEISSSVNKDFSTEERAQVDASRERIRNISKLAYFERVRYRNHVARKRPPLQ